MRKSAYGVSVKVQNKFGCTTTEDDKMLFQLEISDLLVNYLFVCFCLFVCVEA